MPKAKTDKKTKTISKSKKTLIVIGASTAVAVLIISFIYRVVAISLFVKTANVKLPQAIDNVSLMFSSSVQTEAKTAIQLANSTVTKRFCAEPEEKKYRADMEYEAALYTKNITSNMLIYYSEKDDMAYITNYGGMKASAIPELKKLINDALALPRTQPYTVQINPNFQTGELNLCVAATVFNSSGKASGVIITPIPVKYYLEKIDAMLPKDIGFFVTDENLNIIGSREPESDGKNLIEIVTKQTGDKIKSIASRPDRQIRESFILNNGVNYFSLVEGINWNMFTKMEYNNKVLYSGVAIAFYFIVVAGLIVIAIGLIIAISKYFKMRDDEEKLGKTLFDQTQNLVVASKETAATSQDQSAAVKEIVATMEDTNRLSENISEKIKDVASVADKTTTDVCDGGMALEVNVQKLHEIFEANEKTIEGIKNLSKEIDNIWDIVTLITSVADQAKIIAFNAELEAASAGEAGKKFHIVASEIRRLADGIIDSTKEIKDRISEIQHSSDTLILASESGTVKVNEGCETADELKLRFESIRRAAEITADSTKEITTIIQQQTAASGQILITLKQISAGVENFSAATENISSSAETIKEIANSLNEQVAQINE